LDSREVGENCMLRKPGIYVYSLPNIIRMMTSSYIGWKGHVNSLEKSLNLNTKGKGGL
jgi:hypothetical protein